MSIITDALKKAADKRRDVIILHEEGPKADFSGQIREIASKKTRWSFLSGVGAFVIVGVAVAAFMYNAVPQKVLVQKPALQYEAPKIAAFEPEIIERKNLIKRPKEANFLFPSLTLNGIIKGGGEPLAVVNNRILKKGDFIQGAQLIRINSDRVTLLYDDKEIALRIQ